MKSICDYIQIEVTKRISSLGLGGDVLLQIHV